MREHVFSSESVGDGHPDKLADQVSDAILDALLKGDPTSRVAVETLVASGNFAVVAGEVTSAAFDALDIQAIVRKTAKDIGYTSEALGFDGPHCEPLIRVTRQSPDIAQGTAARADAKIGAGDQGMMFGYAQDNGIDGDDYMPVPISLAHGLTRAMARARKTGRIKWMRPDAKSQVTVRFDGDRPIGIDALVLAAQHHPDVEHDAIVADLHKHVIEEVIPEDLLHDGTQFFINHTGKFVTGGPNADTGVTGRKIIVDTYGGWIPHGGGAFSGKDATKVDRSAAYYARYAAKNLVAAGLAKRLQIQVAYSIGSLEPVSYNVDTFGTGTVPDATIEGLLRSTFSFAPGDIIDELGLRAPIFRKTAAFGHFGRTDLDLPWERLDRVDAILEQVSPA